MLLLTDDEARTFAAIYAGLVDMAGPLLWADLIVCPNTEVAADEKRSGEMAREGTRIDANGPSSRSFAWLRGQLELDDPPMLADERISWLLSLPRQGKP